MAIKFCMVFAIMTFSLNLAYADLDGSNSPSRLFKDPSSGMEMVYVKGGCYQMGSTNDDCDANPEERPLHEVCLDDFYIGKYEVTQGEWKSVMGGSDSATCACDDDACPTENKTWSDAQEFIRRMNGRSGAARYRLPTEAEWEFAARSGGSNEKYSGGAPLNRVAWYAENSERKAHPVGTRAPNGLGIYDMSGNVWEITNDWYSGDYYKKSPRNNPTGPDSGVDRVVRGGSVAGGLVTQRTSRRTRLSDVAKNKDRCTHIGFRLVMTQ